MYKFCFLIFQLCFSQMLLGQLGNSAMNFLSNGCLAYKAMLPNNGQHGKIYDFRNRKEYFVFDNKKDDKLEGLGVMGIAVFDSVSAIGYKYRTQEDCNYTTIFKVNFQNYTMDSLFNIPYQVMVNNTITYDGASNLITTINPRQKCSINRYSFSTQTMEKFEFEWIDTLNYSVEQVFSTKNNIVLTGTKYYPNTNRIYSLVYSITDDSIVFFQEYNPETARSNLKSVLKGDTVITIYTDAKIGDSYIEMIRVNDKKVVLRERIAKQMSIKYLDIYSKIDSAFISVTWDDTQEEVKESIAYNDFKIDIYMNPQVLQVYVYKDNKLRILDYAPVDSALIPKEKKK